MEASIAAVGGEDRLLSATDDRVFAMARSNRSDALIKAPMAALIGVTAMSAVVLGMVKSDGGSPWAPLVIVLASGGALVSGVGMYTLYDYMFPDYKGIEQASLLFSQLDTTGSLPYSRLPGFRLTRKSEHQAARVVQRTPSLVVRTDLKSAFPDLPKRRVLLSLRLTRELEESYLQLRSDPQNVDLRRTTMVNTLRIIDLHNETCSIPDLTDASEQELENVQRIIRREIWIRKAVAGVRYTIPIVIPAVLAVAVLQFVDLGWLRNLVSGLAPTIAVGSLVYSVWRRFILGKQDPLTDLQTSAALAAPQKKPEDGD